MMTEQKQVIPEGYKQTEVGVIPTEWDIKYLSELSELTSSKRIFENDYVLDGIPFFRGQEISLLLAGEKLRELCFISKSRFQEILRKFGAPIQGDILITAVGTLGNAYLIENDEPFYFKDGNLIWLRKVCGVNPKYLIKQLHFHKNRILDCAIGSSQKALTIVSLKDLSVAIPPKQEQTAIANALSDVDALISELEKLIAKKQAIKTATMQQLLTGKTRLPEFALREDGTPKGYKQSELGEIPEDWGVSKIQQLGLVITGGTPATAVSSYWNGDIPWVTPTDISDAKSISKTEREITTDGLAVIRKLPANTVLVTCIASIGKNAILRKAGACNQQINAIIPNELINVEFLYYAIEFSKERLKSSAGMTATPIISKALFSDFSLIVPKFEEQNVIATILSDMDEDIQVLQQRLNKTCQIKQGMMQELLTGKTRLVKPEVTV